MSETAPPIVCKFGGTSLADAAQIRKVREIVEREPRRRFIVPSAPGKRIAQDRKVTDLLYLCHEHAKQGLGFDPVFEMIAERFRGIADELGVSADLAGLLEETKRGIAAAAERGEGPDFAASRGEYLNGRLLADWLGATFVDAGELIFFDHRGRLDETKTYSTVSERLRSLERAVVPGFYGRSHDGGVRTFSRGGSDITGAIVARGVEAEVYENWTDVSGLLMADPGVVDEPHAMASVTYRELRELSYMGARVLHDEAVFPVRAAGIPVHIRNTNEPESVGTRIVPDEEYNADRPFLIAGVAGRRDFTVLAIEKAMMNSELGYGRRVLDVLERHGINFEHMPSGIDTLSVVVQDTQLEGKLDAVLEDLHIECKPDAIEVDPDMALVATVGRGMSRKLGTAARLFDALAGGEVNVRMIDQGSSELNIIVGVNAADYEKAVRAIYAAFTSEAAPAATSAGQRKPVDALHDAARSERL